MTQRDFKLSKFPFDILNRKERLIAVIIAVSLSTSALYLWLSYSHHQDSLKAEAINLAESLEAVLPTGHVSNLINGEESFENFEYDLVKSKLVKLIENTNSIYYAYLLAKKDEKIYVLIDSNLEDTSDYSPLGNISEETSNGNWIPFKTESSVLTKPIKNEWGTWIRALVPVKATDGHSQEIIAILGLSYSATLWKENLWKRMIPDIVQMLTFMMLLSTLIWIWVNHVNLKKKSIKLVFDEALYRNLFEQAPVGIILNEWSEKESWHRFISMNPLAVEILGGKWEDMSNINWMEITHPDDLKVELEEFEKFTKGEIGGYSLEKRLIKPDGSHKWVNIKVSSFLDREGPNFTYLCMIEDISSRKAMEEALKESERSKAVLLSHLPGMAYRARYDAEWTTEFSSSGCKHLTGYTPEELLYNNTISYRDVISEEYRDLVWDKWTKVVDDKGKFSHEYEIITKDEERKWVLELGQGIYDNDGNIEALEGIILDISEKKKRDAQIAYLNERDFLTGLYNRSFLNCEMERLNQKEYLPVSVLICDINGLRMINDAYGHAQGDQLIVEVAKLLENCCGEEDLLGRISGGEFMIIMPQTSEEESYEIIMEINASIESFNRSKLQSLYEISVTAGFGTIETEKQSVAEAIKEAESYLKSRKLLNQKSMHHSILSSIMATLYAKSQETEEHGQRLGDYSCAIGTELGLDQKDLDDLKILSMIHDIGKIGIDDSILNKPGKLTAEEWDEMKRHPEIGYRIAMSTPELSHIADYILCHHERWDGTGYPKGLQGSDIPMLSRILAIADAYDAMTEDRVYRKALSNEDAIGEIRRGAGSQFDPDIAALFIRIMDEKSNFYKD